MNYRDFDEDELDPLTRQRLDLEFNVLSALREVLGIAAKGETRRPTYQEAFALGVELIPSLFNPETSLLGRKWESPTVREYRQRALAETELRGEPVEALELINREIIELERLLETRVDNLSLLERRLGLLTAAAQQLRTKRFTENQLIFRDVFDVARPSPVQGCGETYRDFQVAPGQILRVRVLHPNPPEFATGADLIYEQYWKDRRLVRLAALQYKTWTGRVLYRNDRLTKQLDRLHQAFCGNDLCKLTSDSRRSDSYRLPFCSAFLRLTDQVQRLDSRLTSSGYHIPLCVIKRLWENTKTGGQRIESRFFMSECITNRIFEELFNHNMLGSRWLTYDELTKLYVTYGVLENDEHVTVRVEEFAG